MIRYKKNPRSSNKLVVIEVDGKKYWAKYIGKGQFSKVYRVGDRVVYYTKGDCGKEVLSLYVYDKTTHLPEIIRHENITKPGVTWWVFSSPYYRNVTSKDRSAYQLMNVIIAEYNKFRREYTHYQQQAYGRIKDGYILMYAFVEYGRGRFPGSIVNVLYSLVELARSCGDNIGFDFKKNNFGVNEYGTLILRDVIWVWG